MAESPPGTQTQIVNDLEAIRNTVNYRKEELAKAIKRAETMDLDLEFFYKVEIMYPPRNQSRYNEEKVIQNLHRDSLIPSDKFDDFLHCQKVPDSNLFRGDVRVISVTQKKFY